MLVTERQVWTDRGVCATVECVFHDDSLWSGERESTPIRAATRINDPRPSGRGFRVGGALAGPVQLCQGRRQPARIRCGRTPFVPGRTDIRPAGAGDGYPSGTGEVADIRPDRGSAVCVRLTDIRPAGRDGYPSPHGEDALGRGRFRCRHAATLFTSVTPVSGSGGGAGPSRCALTGHDSHSRNRRGAVPHRSPTTFHRIGRASAVVEGRGPCLP